MVTLSSDVPQSDMYRHDRARLTCSSCGTNGHPSTRVSSATSRSYRSMWISLFGLYVFRITVGTPASRSTDLLDEPITQKRRCTLRPAYGSPSPAPAISDRVTLLTLCRGPLSLPATAASHHANRAPARTKLGHHWPAVASPHQTRSPLARRCKLAR